MPTITHAYRASMLGDLLTFTLDGTVLRWQGKDGGGDIPLDEISQIRLNRVPSIGSDPQQCELRMRNGAKVLLKSAHYKSIGSFENRSETYTALMRALLPRVAEANPQARFFRGNSVLWWVWLILFVLCGLIVAMLGAALLSGKATAAPGWAAVAIVLLSMPMLWRGLRRGRRRPFDPAEMPEDLL